MSETMNLHQVPEFMTFHRALWAGRIMSAFVVIALVADGTIQLFAPAQIASMLQETGFAMDLTRVVGPIILACAILYAIPATAVLGAILVTGFLGGAICAHVRIGELGSPPEIISLLLGAMTWGGLYARDPRIRAILPLVLFFYKCLLLAVSRNEPCLIRCRLSGVERTCRFYQHTT